MIKKDRFQKLLDKVYRYLAHRPRSEKEIRDYLKKKKVTLGDTAKIFKLLREKKLVDDEVFTSWWIEQRNTFRPRGKFALRHELHQKGIASDLVQEMIDKMVNELPLAQKVFVKKRKVYERLSARKFRQKMAALLARRGFSWSTIGIVLDSINSKGDN